VRSADCTAASASVADDAVASDFGVAMPGSKERGAVFAPVTLSSMAAHPMRREARLATAH
jgi:hypothetical protein